MSQVASTDELVTKTDLATFYQGILPYLGGMPEMVANKFTKSDLYSADEKIIGQWVDGKPIYQKTVDFGALPNNTEKAVAHGISNLGTLVDVIAIANDGNGIQKQVPFIHDTTITNQSILNINPTEVWMRTKADCSRYTAYVTLKYTKSTDSAISMGSDTDYSTTEKIIGTWVNGKPIYQKTIESGTLPKNSSKTIALDIPNIGKVLNIFGYAYVATGTASPRSIHLPFYSSAGFITIDVRNGNSLFIGDNGSFDNFTESYITIQYLKTTD